MGRSRCQAHIVSNRPGFLAHRAACIGDSGPPSSTHGALPGPVGPIATYAFLLLILCLIPGLLRAGDKTPTLPRIALIIDDLGNQWEPGVRAIGLPGPVSYAFLPHTPFVEPLAEQAHAKGGLVMVHLPMESESPHRLGPGALTQDQDKAGFRDRADSAIHSVPYAQGVNNHMGSRLTREPQAMNWLMELLREDGSLFFIDSRTTVHTIAERTAREHGVAATRRDVFLDNRRDIASIEAQLRRLLAIARQKGSAVAIGHPYPETLAVLEVWLPTLLEKGFQLVGVDRIVYPEGMAAATPSNESPVKEVSGLAVIRRLKDQHLLETVEDW